MTTLEDIETKELLRALYSNKEYLSFDISVFNAGHCTRLTCSNTYTPAKNDGYSFVLENSFENDEAIIYVLRGRLTNMVNTWTRDCYYYTWDEFLKRYGISQYNYNRMLKIEREF